MSDKLRECPFCGSYEKLFKNHSESCFLRMFESISMPNKSAVGRFSSAEMREAFVTRHEPKHETVEQWEKRTGEIYPDDGPVWAEYRKIGPNAPDSTYFELKEYGLVKVWDSDERRKAHEYCIVANHHGKPKEPK